MATNFAIDDRLLSKAHKLSGLASRRETVNEALREFVQRRQRVDLVNVFGKVRYDPKYGHRTDRRAR